MSALILVADDDADNRTIARDILETAGYRVIQAVNGLEALAMAKESSPDLILLDLSMPKMSGWEAAKKIREEAGLARTPIVAFTAHALQGDELKARAAGCDDYISKPCTPSDVLAKVRSWLPARPGAEERKA